MNKSENPRVVPVMGKLKDRIDTNLKIRIPEKVSYTTRQPSTAPTTTRMSPQFANGSMKNHFPKNWNIDSGCDLEKDDYFVTTPSSMADTSPIMSQFMNTASCPTMSFLKLGIQDFDVSNNY